MTPECASARTNGMLAQGALLFTFQEFGCDLDIHGVLSLPFFYWIFVEDVRLRLTSFLRQKETRHRQLHTL